jgi:GDSL-like Lipase/Acylhydrolase family
MLGRRRTLIAVCAIAALATVPTTAVAEAAPEHMDWTVQSRYGGSAGENGRLDRPAGPLGRLDVFPVVVRPPAFVCEARRARWTVDGRPPLAVKPSGGRDCTARLAIRGEGRHSVVVEAGGRTAVATPEIDDRLVVALGDSVASGEGNRQGKHLWLDGPCHRSAVAGFEQAARLIGQSLAGRRRGASLTFVSLACSGAEIREGLLGSYGGVDPDGDRTYAPQVRRLRLLREARDGRGKGRGVVDAVLLSVGANDVQFSSIVKKCAAPGDCRKGREDDLLTAFGRLRRGYDLLGAQLRRVAPDTPVLITEYFDPTRDATGRFCGQSVAFTSRDEARWAYEALLRPLNLEGEIAAARHDWHHVGGIAADFERHGYCAGGERWVRLLLESAIFQGDLTGTLHPSRPGHAAIARRVAIPLAEELELAPPPETTDDDEGGEGWRSWIDDRVAALTGFITEPLLSSASKWIVALRLVFLVVLLFLFVRLLRFFLRPTVEEELPTAPAPPRGLPKLPDEWRGKVAVVAGGPLVQLSVWGFLAALVGGAVLWLRFDSSNLPADQAVDVVGRGELIAIGTQALALFFLLGLLAVAVAFLLDGTAQAARSTRVGLVAIGLVEMFVAVQLGDFPGDQEAQILLGLVVAALLFHFLVDRAIQRWFSGGSSLSPQLTATRQELPEKVRAVLDALRPGRLLRGLWRAISHPLRSLRWLWRATPFALLAAAVAVTAFADGPSRYMALVLLVLAAMLFVGRGGIAREAARGKDTTDGLEAARAAIAVAGIACVFVILARDEPWLAATAAIAILLGLGCLVVGALSGTRFAPYAVAVLLSVPLFGASATLLRGLDTPELQPVAALTKDGNAICGAYVGESDGRLWVGRPVLDERADVRVPRRGSIVSFDRDQLETVSVGPLAPVGRAQGQAVVMREELLAATGRPAIEKRWPTCSPPPPKVEVKDTWQRRLAERFQPELVIDREDGFWPVPVRTLFSMEDRRAAICRRVAGGRSGCLRLSTQGSFPWAGGQGEWIEYPAANTDREAQHDLMVDALGSADPARSTRIYFLVSGDWRGERPITIQYWFFYPFNYQPIRDGILEGGYHEGDFESVGVLLSGETHRPRYLWMARHDKEGRVFPWDDDALTVVDDHPTVFVARGSHASYESCGDQVRYVAKYKLVDDHPTCDEDRQLHLSPEATPMTDLSHVPWGCWRGLFGHKNEERSYERIPYLVSDAPRSPLWQQNFGDVKAEPCRGIEDPEERDGAGEETVEEGGEDEVPARLRARAGRLEPLVDHCADWEAPPATGTFLLACDQTTLSSYLASGLEVPGPAGVRIDVAHPAKPQVGEFALPAMRRNRDGAYLDAWRIVAGTRTVVSVFASCWHNEDGDDRDGIVAARFRNVVVEPDAPLRVHDRGPGGRWLLLRPDGTEAASAVPSRAHEVGGRLVPGPPNPGARLPCGA